MTKKLFPVLVILFLIISTPVFAKNDKSENQIKTDVKIHTGGNSDNENGQGSENQKLKIKVNEEDNEFEIRGEISSVLGNSFVIGGQTVKIDPSKVEKLKLKGILEVGNNAKVEGKIIDGEKFAEEIKLIGTGQGRFKFEIKNLVLGSSPIPSSTPSSEPDTNLEATISASPSPSTNINADVKIKAVGPVDQVVEFLGQILGFLQNIIGGSDTEPTPSPTPSVTPSPNSTPSPDATPSSTPIPDSSPSPTPQATASPDATPSPTATPDVNAAANVKITSNGPIQNVINFLEEVIDSLLSFAGGDPNPTASPTPSPISSPEASPTPNLSPSPSASPLTIL